MRRALSFAISVSTALGPAASAFAQRVSKRSSDRVLAIQSERITRFLRPTYALYRNAESEYRGRGPGAFVAFAEKSVAISAEDRQAMISLFRGLPTLPELKLSTRGFALVDKRAGYNVQVEIVDFDRQLLRINGRDFVYSEKDSFEEGSAKVQKILKSTSRVTFHRRALNLLMPEAHAFVGALLAGGLVFFLARAFFGIGKTTKKPSGLVNENDLGRSDHITGGGNTGGDGAGDPPDGEEDRPVDKSQESADYERDRMRLELCKGSEPAELANRIAMYHTVDSDEGRKAVVKDANELFGEFSISGPGAPIVATMKEFRFQAAADGSFKIFESDKIICEKKAPSPAANPADPRVEPVPTPAPAALPAFTYKEDRTNPWKAVEPNSSVVQEKAKALPAPNLLKEYTDAKTYYANHNPGQLSAEVENLKQALSVQNALSKRAFNRWKEGFGKVSPASEHEKWIDGGLTAENQIQILYMKMTALQELVKDAKEQVVTGVPDASALPNSKKMDIGGSDTSKIEI